MTTAADRVRGIRGGVGVVALAAMALTTSACGSEETAEFDGGDEQSEQTAVGEESVEGDAAVDGAESTGESGVGSEESASPGGDGPGGGAVDPADAVETITYPIPRDSRNGIEGTMTVGLHHLRVEGRTMELLLTYTPEFDQHEQYTLWELHARNHSLVAPSLYDRENLKRYSILGDGGWSSGGVWATRQADVELASGETQAYWANFAVPEDDIETINVGIPNVPEFKDVEIEWGDQESSDESAQSTDEGGA